PSCRTGGYWQRCLWGRYCANAARNPFDEDIPFMSMLIAAFVCIALLAISVAHFIWAVGLSWPLRDRKLLAKTVVGFTGVEKMPHPLLTLVVACGTFYAAAITLAIADHDGGGTALNIVGGIIG